MDDVAVLHKTSEKKGTPLAESQFITDTKRVFLVDVFKVFRRDAPADDPWSEEKIEILGRKNFVVLRFDVAVEGKNRLLVFVLKGDIQSSCRSQQAVDTNPRPPTHTYFFAPFALLSLLGAHRAADLIAGFVNSAAVLSHSQRVAMLLQLSHKSTVEYFLRLLVVL